MVLLENYIKGIDDNKDFLQIVYDIKVERVNKVKSFLRQHLFWIQNSVFEGEVTGEHQAGGIAGENSGIVSECENKGSINTIPISTASSSTPIITNFTLDRTFDISEVSEDNFLDITDIGGIAGYSEGIIENCTNSEKVGYDRTGYNIGGIVGRESGYIDGCNNKAATIKQVVFDT